MLSEWMQQIVGHFSQKYGRNLPFGEIVAFCATNEKFRLDDEN